eukprot:3816895-Alexandrium_andersonii.AAC.1
MCIRDSGAGHEERGAPAAVARVEVRPAGKQQPREALARRAQARRGPSEMHVPEVPRKAPRGVVKIPKLGRGGQDHETPIVTATQAVRSHEPS